MKSKHNLFSIFLLSLLFFSCVEENFPDENSNDKVLGREEDYAITFAFTLDRMGGTRSPGDNPNEYFESYIDPQKCRVLFFDSQDRFLFESKSRWVKQMETTSNEESMWFVSVPFFSSGNDIEEFNWDWDNIREALLTGSFKIAIIANLAHTEYLPDLKDNKIQGQKWFENTGPNWNKLNSICHYNPNDTENIEKYVKKVFDLHHVQWDPIYHNKGIMEEGSNDNFYDYILYSNINNKNTVVKGEEEEDRPTMGALSCWVDINGEDADNKLTDNKDPYGWGYRRSMNVSEAHPIPMYGIQEFAPIVEKEWPKGTTINLNRDGDNKISLLRSVVKLELIIPKSAVNNQAVDFVALWYSNVYARCLPMDCWTSTERIWEQEHGTDCEWYDIQNNGPIVHLDEDGATNEKDYYQKRMAWFYGKWLEQGWGFGSLGKKYVEDLKEKDDFVRFPSVYNSCIQRNATVFVADKSTKEEKTASDFSNDNYYHYIVYTGERNMNDPAYLNRMGEISGNGRQPVIFWQVGINGTIYSIPITDYNVANNPAFKIETISGTEPANNGDPRSSTRTDYGTYNYMWEVANSHLETNLLPWTLMRNHVYRLTLGKKTGTRSGETGTLRDLNIKAENLYSNSISFNRPNAGIPTQKLDTVKNVVKLDASVVKQ